MPMNNDFPTNPTWEQIKFATYYQTQKVFHVHKKSITAIVALSRGGLVPGVLASHYSGASLLPVTYSSKQGHGDNRNHANQLPDLTEQYQDPINLVIIDDICDSGKTKLEVYEHFVTHTPPNSQITTVALYQKEQAAFTVDFYHWKIPQNGSWIVFPWEVDPIS